MTDPTLDALIAKLRAALAGVENDARIYGQCLPTEAANRFALILLLAQQVVAAQEGER